MIQHEYPAADMWPSGMPQREAPVLTPIQPFRSDHVAYELAGELLRETGQEAQRMPAKKSALARNGNEAKYHCWN